MWAFHDGMGWWMMFGGMWMVVFWAIMIGLVVWGIGRLGGSYSRRPDADVSPLDLAKSRLAKGEISLEEFEVIRSKLQE